MESIIKRAIDWWFSDDLLKVLALEVLLKVAKSTGKVDSLQGQAIKSIIRMEIGQDLDQNVIFNLIFKEPVDLCSFMDRFLLCIYTNTEISAISAVLKRDPEVFFWILGQNLRNEICNDLYILVKKKELQIVMNQFLSLELPHSEGNEFDFEWAAKFAKLIFSKGTLSVSLQMDGEDIHDGDSMCECLENTLNNLNWVKPAEGWEEAINRSNRPIYIRFGDTIINGTIYTTHFAVVKEYSASCSKDYYGYIE